MLSREREGGYLGNTVQVIPHVTNEIKSAISSFDGEQTDITITEIGGTAGDIESLPFLEALRQYRHKIGVENAIFIHLTLVPYIKAAGEMKTKPSQQSVAILRGIGIIPDILVCRCERHMDPEHMAKLALFCNVREDMVIEEKDVANSIYEVPGELAKQDVDKKILKLLALPERELDLADWEDMVRSVISPSRGELEIAVVGKYNSIPDAYKSINEALTHAGIANDVKVRVRMVGAEDIEERGAADILGGVDGVLVPGGFGERGVEGKIQAVKYARENGIPFLGICLGMQCAVIDFARHVCGLAKANSSEFNADTPHPVIHPDGGAEVHQEQRRHDAPGLLALRPQARLQGHGRLPDGRDRRAPTATATSSTTSSRSSSPAKG